MSMADERKPLPLFENTGLWVEIYRHLRLMGLYFRFNLAAAIEYRWNFWLQVVGMMINNAAFLVFWALVYSRIQNIGGYGFREVMFIWALASASFGFTHILFGNVRQLSRMIMQGELDAYLVQPKNVYVNVLCSRTIVSAWGDLLYGVLLFFLIYGWNPWKLLLFGTFIVWSGCLMGSIFFTAETLTFFMGNGTALSRLVTEFLLTFTLYPESIYHGPIRSILYSLIPAGFIVFVPLRLIGLFSWTGLGYLFLLDMVYIIGGYLLFQWGLKRYTSGNLISTRL